MYEDPAEDDPTPMNEEQRRIVHENYLKLISQPIKEPEVHEVDVVPVAEEIDTEKLIYNNKPETERDYRNLINNLFVKTIKHSMPVEEQPIERATPAATVKLEDVHSKADNDGGIFKAIRQGIIILAITSPTLPKFTFKRIETIKIIKIKITVITMQAEMYKFDDGLRELFPKSV